MKHSHLVRGLLALSSILFVTGIEPARAQSSTRELGGGAVDWFNASGWSNGVANGAGAIATLNLAPGSVSTVNVGRNFLTLEQLRVQGRGAVSLAPTGLLTFQNDGAGELLIEIAPDGGDLTATMGIPYGWSAADLLRLEVGPQGNLILNGVTGSSGNLLKTGAGSTRLAGANAAWNGNFEIANGTVTVAHAQALGTAVGSTTIRGGGRLILQSTTAESLVIDGGVVQAANLDLNGAISISGAATIHRPKNATAVDPRGGEYESPLGVTNIYGSISGAGDLTIRNESRDAILVRGNNAYTGHTYITAGVVNAMTASALGSSSGGTTISGGTLNLSAASAEPMFVRGGSLVFANSAAMAGPMTLQTGVINFGSVNYAQAISLDQASDASIYGSGIVSGGIAGTGDVTLRGSLVVNGAPIANQGDLIIAGTGSQPIRLESANTFTGSLVVSSGEAIVDHQDAMSGQVRLNGGRLTINRSDMIVDAEIRASRGSLQTSGEVSGPIILEGTTGVTGFIGGRLTGQISGAGDVDFSGREGNVQTISGENTFEGVAGIANGTVNATSATAFGSTAWATIVRSGTLNVNASTNEKFFVDVHGTLNLNAPVSHLPRMLVPESGQQGVQQISVNVPSAFDGPAEAAQGRLQVNANSSVDSLLIRDAARVTIAPGASLHLAGDIELREGQLEGSVTGAPTIRKTTFAGAALKEMPLYAGQIVVEQGVLEAYSGALGTASGSTRVARDAQLMTRGIGVIADDIYLEDAIGPQNRGGLYMGATCCSGSTTVMNGRLDLGPNGSIIGAGGNVNNEILRINTPVSGGSLTTWGSGISLHLANSNNAYTGVTDIRQGILTLIGNGSLGRTSGIVLHESEGSFDATLNLSNHEGGNVDRVQSQVPIEFRGGRLSGFGGGSETFGTLRFAAGRSEIDAREMTLAASRIERETGAILYAELAGHLAVTEAPASTAGLLPWMLVRPGTSTGPGPHYELFGEVTSGQVRAMNRTSITTNINAATAADSVGVTAAGGATLTGDRTVKSLLLEYRGILDLGGHTLKVASGGISAAGGEIRNGNITATAGRELILHGGGWINANIIDSAEGPLDVTVGGGNFSGDNSFTGKLFVNELTASFRNENSLPAGIDVDVVGGILEVAYTPTAVKHLGKLRVAGGGKVTQNGQFSFEEVTLEYGEILVAKLAGNGPIRKSTIGTASINPSLRSDASYTGTISVDEGMLNVLGLPAARYEVNGGRLRLEQAANPITLNGGEIEFRSLSGPIAVNGPSTMIGLLGATSSSLTGPLSGAGELTFNSGAQYFDAGEFSRNMVIGIDRNNAGFSGSVHIQAADMTVYQNGALGTGEITVHAGGSLKLSSTSFGDGFANQVVLDGGTLKGTSAPQLAGALRVVSPSYVGGINVVGPVYLADAPLTTLSNATTRFLGDMHVGGHSSLILGRNQDSSRGSVELGGTIRADRANSLLNITRGGLDELLFTASLHVDAGRSLQLQLDDAPMTVSLAAGAKISGSGVIANDVHLSAGGSASPGTSPGTLTVDGDLTFETGSRFDLELAAGQHDKLVVTGQAAIGGGMLNISFLDGYLPAPNDAFAILEADTLTGMFSNANGLKSFAAGWRVDWNLNQVGADLVLQATAVALQADFTGNGVVDGDDLAAWKMGYGASGDASHQQGDANGDGRVDGSDYLVWQRQFGGLVTPPASAAVPEPESAALAALAALAVTWRRRSRRE